MVLGGVREHLLHTVDAVFTVNGHLAATIARRGHDDVSVNSNGLRTGIECFDQAASLDRGEVTAGYFGYLSDAWFDWNLVVKAAELRPGWRCYLIGYGEDARHLDDLPPNVVFLGKMPQRDLARYAANWDVAIVPFKESELAAGADPIKIYEYLAMGLPVVVTGVFGPPGAEAWVHRATTVDEFASLLETAAAATAADRNEGRCFAEGLHLVSPSRRSSVATRCGRAAGWGQAAALSGTAMKTLFIYKYLTAGGGSNR